MAQIKELVKVGEGDRPLEFFEETLGKLRLREGMKGSHWAKVRDTLPKHIRQCIPCDSCGEDGNSMSNRTEKEDVQEASEGEPDEALSAAGLAENQKLSGRSSYIVPLKGHQVGGVIDLTAEQAEGTKMAAASDGKHVEGCEYDSDSFLLCARSSKQQRDAYQDFMPMF